MGGCSRGTQIFQLIDDARGVTRAQREDWPKDWPRTGCLPTTLPGKSRVSERAPHPIVARFDLPQSWHWAEDYSLEWFHSEGCCQIIERLQIAIFLPRLRHSSRKIGPRSLRCLAMLPKSGSMR
jgi:hypothetical protein